MIELMTVPEVAELLRYKDLRPVYDLIHTGDLQAFKIGRNTYRINRKDLEQFIKDKIVKVPSL